MLQRLASRRTTISLLKESHSFSYRLKSLRKQFTSSEYSLSKKPVSIQAFPAMKRYFCSSLSSEEASDLFPENQKLASILYKKLKESHLKYNQLNAELSNPDQQDKKEDSQSQISHKEIDRLSYHNSLFNNFETWLEDFQTLKDFKQEEEIDKEFIKEEETRLDETIKEIIDEAIDALVEKDKYDDCAATMIEFRPGAGGAESMIWAEEIYYAIQAYAQNQGWR